MNFLNIFEDRVAGIFGAAQAPFSFKKLAKQAAREMEDQTLVINGVNTAPALYTVLIASDDDQLLAPYYSQLAGEVTEFVRAQAEKKRYRFVGTPLVRFMIDPSLKPGKFSVFAENVDAPTLARLYEEERAYLKGASGKSGKMTATPSPVPVAAPAAVPVANPALDAALDPLSAPVAGAAEVADPFAPAPAPIPVPQTMTREQLAGMGGAAAATGAGIAAAGAAHMAPAKPSAPARPLAQLVDVVTGDTYELTSARATVGRERSVADVVLRDPNVSRRHAELTFTGSDWSIEDLNSTNGTMVNNRRITRCPLRNGDVLTFGLSTFEFRG